MLFSFFSERNIRLLNFLFFVKLLKYKFGEKKMLKLVEFKRKNIYIMISVENEKNYKNYSFKLILTTKKNLVNQNKNIIFCKILRNGKHFKNEIFYSKFQINLNAISFKFNFYFTLIQLGIDLEKYFLFRKKINWLNISICFFGGIIHSYESIEIAERYHPGIELFSCGIFSGDKLILKVDSAELILPENCLFDEEVISMRKCVRLEYAKNKIQFFNLIECLPHNLKFSKSLKLRIKSPSSNITIYKSKKKPKEIHHGIFQLKISHFCLKGLVAEWEGKNILKIYYSFYLNKVNNFLTTFLSISPIDKVNLVSLT